jgi:hypothetical protein
MTSQPNPNLPQLNADEKTSHLMVYTQQSLIWGQVITKQAVRVSTWMRTEMAPQYMRIINAQMLLLGGAAPKPLKFQELLVQSDQVLAYHVLPPTSEPIDYDPNEPNRKMEPTAAIVGVYRFDGTIRMADQTNLERYLSVSKAVFHSLYDASMTCPVMPSIKGVSAPMVLIRDTAVTFIPK